MNLLKRLVKEEEGQGMIEYVLIIALISIAAIVIMKAVSGNVNGVFEKVNTELNSAV